MESMFASGNFSGSFVPAACDEKQKTKVTIPSSSIASERRSAKTKSAPAYIQYRKQEPAAQLGPRKPSGPAEARW